jgi:lysophospholipase L1-like esterase
MLQSRTDFSSKYAAGAGFLVGGQMNRWRTGSIVIFASFYIALASGCSHQPPATHPSTVPRQASANKWEGEIAAFAKQDEQTPPPAHPIVFVGSSTIRFWKVSEAFPGMPVLNRGFGGSETADAVYYFDRVVGKYQPSIVVFYSGDNDLNAGKSPDQVIADTREFIDLLRKRSPKSKLVFIAIKPSIARWKLIDKIRETNQRTQTLVASYPGGVFVNIESKILGDDGKPRAELFRMDGLHLNEKGYEILNEAVRPYLR